ncbi:MAG: alanine racemase [Gemmatimonadota bacterium]
MHSGEEVRAGCRGLPPLTARLEPWQRAVLSNGARLRDWVDDFGSPVNLHQADPFERNARALQEIARAHGVELEILFARKANKALVYVERARVIGVGVDTASDAELSQALAMGMPSDRLVSTAAVKSGTLIRRCIDADVPIVVDSADELERVRALAADSGTQALVVLRISGFRVGGRELTSRFGLHPDEVLAMADSIPISTGSPSIVRLEGLHFHLDGYDATHRVAGLRCALRLADELRSRGHAIASIDMGGGFPMRYLDDGEEWWTFSRALDDALLGRRPPVTHGNDGMGRRAVDGRVVGELALYPYFQDPVASEWLAGILDADSGEGGSLAEALRRRGLVLRCEPGRSLLDGCGLTVARVEHRKRHRDGSWSIGLSMNRSQCATSKPDHAVDPLLVTSGGSGEDRTPAVEGYLTGASCTESDFLSRRRLSFPLGVARGDLVVFPNTAGYLMHFVESRSHQFPLARNLVVQGPDFRDATPDPIDETA